MCIRCRLPGPSEAERKRRQQEALVAFLIVALAKMEQACKRELARLSLTLEERWIMAALAVGGVGQ